MHLSQVNKYGVKQKQNEEPKRLARRNERNNKIQGVKNTNDVRNNTIG